MTDAVKDSAETTFYEYLLSDIKTRREDPKFDDIRYAIADLGLHLSLIHISEPTRPY